MLDAPVSGSTITVEQGQASIAVGGDAATLERDLTLDADVAIVGTGAGGGVTAEILSAAGLDVVLIEEGPLKSSSDFKMLEAEAYPQLKADKNFLELQKELIEIEDQIQMARRYYNGAVRNLNISIQSFPGVLMARPFGFHAEPFFELDDRAQAAAPQVAFPEGKP